MKTINIAQLRAFHTVAAEGGFTKAARLLNVTQPTLSQEVKALEEAHGLLLLDRSRRTVVPTEIGESLFAVTRRLFAAEQEALELLGGARHLEAGRLGRCLGLRRLFGGSGSGRCLSICPTLCASSRDKSLCRCAALS